MKTSAMVLKEYGEKASFISEEIELPPLGENQVLLKVEATSMNPVDNKILRGAPIGPELPSALHGDVVGQVVEVGAQVKDFKLGDNVFGIAGGVTGYGGASANHMVVNEDLIYQRPEKLDAGELAALPLVFVTAYEALIEKAKLQKGQELLVIGGTGGVGHQAVQLGNILGAVVTAVVSSESQAEIAKSLGAHKTINRHEVAQDKYCETAQVPQGFDVIFDTVGGPNIDNDWDLIRPNGQVVTTTSMESHDLTAAHMKGASFHVVFMLLPMLTKTDQKRHQNILKYLHKKVQEGSIRPLIDSQQFELSQINEAHAYYESGKHTGKIIIRNQNN